MPVTCRLGDSSNAVFTIASGIVSFAELTAHVEAKEAQGWMALPELFDARDITLDVSLSDLQCVAEQVKRALGSQAPGRVAVITNSAFVYGLTRAYAALSKDDNSEFEIFQTEPEARAWLLDCGTP